MIWERCREAWSRFFGGDAGRAPVTAKRALGDAGEREAARFLENAGHRVLVRNWRCGRDELDLVTLAPERTADGAEVLVFVEVKTRDAADLKGGYHAVDTRKRRALRRAVRGYLRSIRRPEAVWRFDVVEVKRDKNDSCRVVHHCAVPLSSG